MSVIIPLAGENGVAKASMPGAVKRTPPTASSRSHTPLQGRAWWEEGRGHPMVLWNGRLRPGKCLSVPPDRMGSPLFKSCCYCLTVLLTVPHLEDWILTYHWNLYSPFLPQTSLRFLTLSLVVFKAVYSCSGASQVAQWWRICLWLRRHRFDSWVGKIPWRRKWKPTSGFLPGKSHGWRSLVGYSPWGQRRVGYSLASKQQHSCF